MSRLGTPNGAAGSIGDLTQPLWQTQRLPTGGPAQIAHFWLLTFADRTPRHDQAGPA